MRYSYAGVAGPSIRFLFLFLERLLGDNSHFCNGLGNAQLNDLYQEHAQHNLFSCELWVDEYVPSGSLKEDAC